MCGDGGGGEVGEELGAEVAEVGDLVELEGGGGAGKAEAEEVCAVDVLEGDGGEGGVGAG